MDNYIKLINDDGQEVLGEVLFTFENDGKNYVLLMESQEYEDIEQMQDIDANVLAYQYEEEEDGTIGQLIEIQTDEEWEIVEEMFNTFTASEIDQDDLEDEEME